MTDALERMRKLGEEMSSAPWAVAGKGGMHMDGTRDGYKVERTEHPWDLHNPYFSKEDAEGIVAARNAWPALCAVVEAAANEELTYCDRPSFTGPTLREQTSGVYVRCGMCPPCLLHAARADLERALGRVEEDK